MIKENSILRPSIGSAFSLVVWLLFVGSVFGCEPAVPTICQAYSRAEAVFVGKLIKIEKVKSNRAMTEIVTTFEVEKVFKGNLQKIEELVFRQAGCDLEINKIDEKYFVYKEQYRYVSNVANRTSLLASAVADIQYATQIEKNDRAFSIQGFVSRLTSEKLRESYIEIENNGKIVRRNFGKRGEFEYLTTDSGTFKVKLVLDTRASLFVRVLGETSNFYETLRTPIEYSVEYKPGTCDYRVVEVGVEP